MALFSKHNDNLRGQSPSGDYHPRMENLLLLTELLPIR